MLANLYTVGMEMSLLLRLSLLLLVLLFPKYLAFIGEAKIIMILTIILVLRPKGQ